MQRKRNSQGFSHHFLLPIIAIFAVGAIGVTTLNLTSASARTYTVANCKTHSPVRNGSKGSCVRVAQKALNKWGKTKKLTVDGVFGPKTKAAVVAFQKSKKLTTDGIVGKNTWAALATVNGASSIAVKAGSTTTSTTKTSTKTTTAKKPTYRYTKCTYTYATKKYEVTMGTPPTVKCSTKTTTDQAIAKESVQQNRLLKEKRAADYAAHKKWQEQLKLNPR